MTGKGRWTSPASTIIPQPSAQSTDAGRKCQSKWNVIPNQTTVYSSTMSHSPRVSRNRESCGLVLPRAAARYAPAPARKVKTGAQKCVTQRVRNSAAVVCDRSVGSK